MINEENQPGNPETAEDAVFGSSSDDFFNALEDNVNSIVQEPEGTEQKTEATSVKSPEVQNQSSVSQDSNVNTELYVYTHVHAYHKKQQACIQCMYALVCVYT